MLRDYGNRYLQKINVASKNEPWHNRCFCYFRWYGNFLVTLPHSVVLQMYIPNNNKSIAHHFAMQWLTSTKTALRFFLSFPWEMLRWLFNRASGLPNTSEYFPSEISFTCSLVQSAPTEAADIPRATKEATWSFIRATSGTTTKQTEHTSSLSPCSR